ncbi:MAG: DUF998 domain-containing protein [Pseudomonadota bacterium]|nr:DUF998 domain-containing protein [Pseudomonadota bacterium]
MQRADAEKPGVQSAGVDRAGVDRANVDRPGVESARVRDTGRWARIASASGLAGALWVVGLTVAGGAAFPGYSHASQYISELGARGAPHGDLVTFAGFLPAALLLMTFAVAAAKALPRSAWTVVAMAGVWLYALGYLVAVPFPCDPGCRPLAPSTSQALHNLGGLVGYLSGPIALLIIAVRARRWPGARALRWLALAGGVTALLAMAGMDPTFAYAGMAQRLIEGSMLTWVVAASLYLRRHPDLRRVHALRPAAA